MTISMSKPKKKTLVQGEIVACYTDVTGQEGYEGQVELLQHSPSRSGLDDEPFVLKELGVKGANGCSIILWKKQRWKVRFIKTGFITHRYIGYFYKNKRGQSF